MIKALIVDDEKNNRENLEQLLTAYCPKVNVIGKADSADAAFAMIRNLAPELVFLDIKMPQKNGFDLLESLSEINFEVIIVTAYNQYAINAIKFCAIDYLLKPIDIIELAKAVDKATFQIQDKKDNVRLRELVLHLKQEGLQSKIALPSLDKVDFVEVNEIIRFEGDNNYCHVYFKNSAKQTIAKTLKEFEELLTPHGFIRTHQSHLINPTFIKAFHKNDGGSLEMMDDSQVPISRAKKKKVLEIIR